MSNLWTIFIYKPLYNGLVLLMSALGGNAGFAVILLTILVKSALFPLSHKSSRTQAVMRNLEGELNKIREKNKDNKQEQARLTMELYKKHNINPFSGCLLILIQFPIIFALYWVFFKGIHLNQELLYSFVTFPGSVNMNFLGFFNLEQKSYILAAIAGITQYIQADLTLPKIEKKKNSEPSFKDDFARSMNLQVKYFLPALIFVISSQLLSVIALYFVTSNIFSIFQELTIKKKMKNFVTIK